MNDATNGSKVYTESYAYVIGERAKSTPRSKLPHDGWALATRRLWRQYLTNKKM